MTITVPTDWNPNPLMETGFADERRTQFQRYNHHHDAKGKFASADGFPPGWSVVDLKTRRDALEKTYVERLDIPADKAGALADRAIDPEGLEVKNGPLTVHFKKEALDDFGGADGADTKRFLSDVDDMQTRFPLPVATIDVQPNRMFGGIGGGIVQGETVERGVGDMRFNSGGLRTDSTLVTNGVSDFHGPVQPEVGPMKWTVAHEWGHAQDHEAVSVVRQAQEEAIKQGVATKYGQFDAAESYAEAFAAYSVKGRDDPLARLYDDHFHWSEKYGSHS